MRFDQTYKQASASPTVTAVNISGNAYASHTGTPTKKGQWRIHIVAGTTAALEADVKEIESQSDIRRVPVRAGGSFVTMIPGLTITLGATVVAGNVFDIAYTSLVLERV